MNGGGNGNDIGGDVCGINQEGGRMKEKLLVFSK